jgi:hypothetical protein
LSPKKIKIYRIKSIKEEVLKFIELVKEEKLKDNFPNNWRVG